MSMFIELNPNMSAEEMREAIKKNEATARTLKNKIKAMDSVSKKSTKSSNDYEYDFIESIIEQYDNSIINDSDDESEEEYIYYYDNMLEAIKSGEDLKDAIYNNLPVLENKNYLNIIMRIILELVKEKEVYEEYRDIDPDALKEINRLDSIIDMIREHHNVKEENAGSVEKTKNNIIFMKTQNGNVYAEQDLALIPSEWYPSFKSLLETIEDGTFKNVKRLTSNPISQGIPEVKDYGIRIVFDKVNPNTYIILDMLVKKSDHDKGYSSQLINRLSIYRQNEKEIKASVTDELIENDRIILENIKKGLDNKYIVKTKGGDTCGL